MSDKLNESDDEYPPLTFAKAKIMNAKQLRNELKKRGINSSGTKKNLINRVKYYSGRGFPPSPKKKEKLAGQKRKIDEMEDNDKIQTIATPPSKKRRLNDSSPVTEKKEKEKEKEPHDIDEKEKDDQQQIDNKDDNVDNTEIVEIEKKIDEQKQEEKEKVIDKQPQIEKDDDKDGDGDITLVDDNQKTEETETITQEKKAEETEEPQQQQIEQEQATEMKIKKVDEKQQIQQEKVEKEQEQQKVIQKEAEKPDVMDVDDGDDSTEDEAESVENEKQEKADKEAQQQENVINGGFHVNNTSDKAEMDIDEEPQLPQSTDVLDLRSESPLLSITNMETNQFQSFHESEPQIQSIPILQPIQSSSQKDEKQTSTH